MKENEMIIKEEILNQLEPFCITDIINKLHKLGINDDLTILSMIEDLYNSNLLYYEKTFPDNVNSCSYNFVTKMMKNNNNQNKTR